jgi:hypothetical protein
VQRKSAVSHFIICNADIVENSEIQLMDKVVFLQYINKKERGEESHNGILPACESLDAAYPFGKGTYNGLIISLYVAFIQCGFKVVYNILFVDMLHNHSPLL